jgi:hypothetical protein
VSGGSRSYTRSHESMIGRPDSTSFTVTCRDTVTAVTVGDGDVASEPLHATAVSRKIAIGGAGSRSVRQAVHDVVHTKLIRFIGVIEGPKSPTRPLPVLGDVGVVVHDDLEAFRRVVVFEEATRRATDYVGMVGSSTAPPQAENGITRGRTPPRLDFNIWVSCAVPSSSPVKRRTGVPPYGHQLPRSLPGGCRREDAVRS